MKDEPPRIVESTKRGEMPRYSLSDKPEVRLCVLAQSSPSISRNLMPASSAARAMPCAIRSIGVSPSATWPRSLSAAPTIAALPRVRPVIARPARLRAPLIGQLALVEMRLIDRERRGFHRRGLLRIASAFWPLAPAAATRAAPSAAFVRTQIVELNADRFGATPHPAGRAIAG